MLAIETSCDETAAAVVEDGRFIRSSVVASQDHLHAGFGGVVPEVAGRAHVDLLTPVVAEAMELARDLAASRSQMVLLHGDFHPGNVLASAREPWLAIDCQRSARGNARRCRGRHYERAAAPQFFFQKIRRGARLVRFQRVRADYLGEFIAAMRGCLSDRAHLVQAHLRAGSRSLPRRFNAGQSTADNDDFIHEQFGARRQRRALNVR